MINMLFLEYSDTTNLCMVTSENAVQDGRGNRLELVALRTAMFPGTPSLVMNSVLSSRSRHAFLSLNQCTNVLKVFAAMIAYLCKGLSLLRSFAMPNQNLNYSDLDPSIDIHEAHVDNVLSDQEVHVRHQSEDGSHENEKVADWHSMFQITAAKEDGTTVFDEPAQLVGTGIYCHTTAAQYGRIAGLQSARAYHLRHPGSSTVFYTSLGFHYDLHFWGLYTTAAGKAKDRIIALRREAYIRTMNNIIHEEIEAIGGCTALLDMAPMDFEVVYTKMAARIQSELHKVAVEFYRLRGNLPQGVAFNSTENADRHQVVADRCRGAGHTAYLQALQQRVPRLYLYRNGKLDVFEWDMGPLGSRQCQIER
jgi:hypothetical protein